MGRSGDSSIASTEEKDSRRKGNTRQRNQGKEKVALTKAYNILLFNYGWTLDYVKGKYIKVCPYSYNPCNWGSCFERHDCKKWDLELIGLTRDMFIHLVEIASDEMYQREKRLYNVISLVMTGKPIIVDKKEQPVNISAKKRDILYDFPYDVPYPSEGEISQNLNFWNSRLKEIEEKGQEIPLAFWDKERAESCKGDHGILARRASVNDLLWVEYKNGAFKEIIDLKNRVRLDFIRISLYPINQRKSICVKPPPITHWKQLYEDGLLRDYVNILKNAGYTDMESVIPLTKELKIVLQHLEDRKPFPLHLIPIEESTEEKQEPPKKECVGPT